jgi:hypothetical protein
VIFGNYRDFFNYHAIAPWHLERAWNLPHSITFYFISDKADQQFSLSKWLRIISGIKYFKDDMVLWQKHMFW